MGLLSVIDAILDQPLDSILAQLPVRAEIKEALLARTGLYWQLPEIAIAQERADWEKVSVLVSETGMNEDRVSSLYGTAVDWSTTLRCSITAPVAGGRFFGFEVKKTSQFKLRLEEKYACLESFTNHRSLITDH
jgi:hypothetical protein